MRVKYEASFQKDLHKTKDAILLRRVKEVINQVKQASNVTEITGARKLKGHVTYYRIRVGDYRIGVEVVTDEVIFTRLLHRKDVYRYFP